MISGCHRSVDEDLSLLGCYAMSIVNTYVRIRGECCFHPQGMNSINRVAGKIGIL
jgi:hypothetical protein